MDNFNEFNFKVVHKFLAFAYPNIEFDDLFSRFDGGFFDSVSFDMVVAVLNFLQSSLNQHVNSKMMLEIETSNIHNRLLSSQNFTTLKHSSEMVIETSNNHNHLHPTQNLTILNKNDNSDVVVEGLNNLHLDQSLASSNQDPSVFAISPPNTRFSFEPFDISSVEAVIEYVFVPKEVLDCSVAYRCYVRRSDNIDEYLLYDCSKRRSLSLSRLALIKLVDGKHGKYPPENVKFCIYELDEEKTNKRVFVANVVSQADETLCNPIVCVCETEAQVFVYV
jgi:hypothetical protein